MIAPTSDTSRVSVITVVLNRVSELEQNLRSVAEQDYPWCDHIVIDGGSDDGTVEFLEEFDRHLACWRSEPDKGIADAMNKGVSRASGEWVLFLHADDRFRDDKALSRAMRHVDDPDSIWAFDIRHGVEGGGRRTSPRQLNFWTRFKNPLPHQGVLCPRRLFDELGSFDTRLLIDMDYDFWMRAYLAGCKLARVPEVLSIMGSDGISSQCDWAGLSRRFSEERKIQRKYASTRLWRIVYPMYWSAYLTYRWVRHRLIG